MTLLEFLQVRFAHSEKLQGSRGYENPGNHSIGPVFFCRFDLIDKLLWKKDRAVDAEHMP
jgi:hypothetical protein